MIVKFEDIGATIRKLRIKKGLKQMDVALTSGYTNAHISRIETEAVEPSIQGAVNILNAMGYEVRILIEPIEEKNNG